jgi:hypothetical protein
MGECETNKESGGKRKLLWYLEQYETTDQEQMEMFRREMFERQAQALMSALKPYPQQPVVVQINPGTYADNDIMGALKKFEEGYKARFDEFEKRLEKLEEVKSNGKNARTE